MHKSSVYRSSFSNTNSPLSTSNVAIAGPTPSKPSEETSSTVVKMSSVWHRQNYTSVGIRLSIRIDEYYNSPLMQISSGSKDVANIRLPCLDLLFCDGES